MQRTCARMRVVFCLSLFGLITLAGSAARAAINSATISPATLPASGGWLSVTAEIAAPTQVQMVVATLDYNGVPGDQVYLFDTGSGDQYSGTTLFQPALLATPMVITATIVATDINGLTTTAQTGSTIQAGNPTPTLVIADAVLSSTTLPASGGTLTISAFLPGALPLTDVEAQIYCNGAAGYDTGLFPQGTSGIYSIPFNVPPNYSHTPQVYTALVDASNNRHFYLSGIVTRQATGESRQAGTTDTVPPVISDPTLTPNAVSVLGGTVTISATVTDPGSDAIGVGSVNAQVYQDGIGLSTVLLRQQFGSLQYTGQVSIAGNTNVQAHTYTAFLQAADHAGNVSFAHVDGACVQPPGDAQPPIIVTAHLRPASLPATGGLVKITATVTDSGGTNTGLSQVTAHLLRDGVSIEGVATLYQLNASSDYEGSFSVGENRTHGAFHYTATVVAVDNLQNQSTAPAQGPCVQANDDQPPVVTQAVVSPATLPATGGTLTVSANIADSGGSNTGVNQVTAYIYINGRPSDSPITLTNRGGSLYSGTYTVLSNGFSEAIYTASVIATDNVFNEVWVKTSNACIEAAQQDSRP